MNRSYKIILLVSLSLMSFIQNLSASPFEIEINHLFQFVQNSGCEFERNGTKHSPEEAVKHIMKNGSAMNTPHTQVASAAAGLRELFNLFYT
jgi:hypothetical protein